MNALLIRISLLSLLIVVCCGTQADAFQNKRQPIKKQAKAALRFWQAQSQLAAKQQQQEIVKSRKKATDFIKKSEKRIPVLQKQAKVLQKQVAKYHSVESLQDQIKQARVEHAVRLDELKAEQEESNGEPSSEVVQAELSARQKVKAKKDELRLKEDAIRNTKQQATNKNNKPKKTNNKNNRKKRKK